jgi:hypothetical protein
VILLKLFAVESLTIASNSKADEADENGTSTKIWGSTCRNSKYSSDEEREVESKSSPNQIGT